MSASTPASGRPTEAASNPSTPERTTPLTAANLAAHNQQEGSTFGYGHQHVGVNGRVRSEALMP